MNIKLAEKVFAPDRVYIGKYTRTLNVEADGYLLDGKIDYENNPAHKLKLIEWIAKRIDTTWNAELASDFIVAITNSNTEKLIEIAEGMLD